MTSKIVVNNIESDSGINTVTIIGDVSVGSSITATDITATHHGSGADLTNLPAANLTGTLPAIDGSNLTGVGASFGNSSVNTSGIITATAFIPSQGQLSHRNIIVNGAMNVAQRGTSSTIHGYGSVDRFAVYNNGTDEAPTHSQVDVASGTTPYTLGFRKALKITNGNQTSGAGAGDHTMIQTKQESQDIAQSGWNYTSASSYVTLSFWVKSSVAQNFYGYFRTKDGTEQIYTFETGSLSADTWTKITKTIPGNSNLQFDNDANQGTEINISPFMGTNFTDSGVSLNAWAAYASGTRTPDYTSTWYTTNDATFEITGVQLEVGSQATPFEHRSFNEELLLCKRYFNMIGDGSLGNHALSDGFFWNSGGTEVDFMYTFPVQMRTAPSIYQVTGSNYFKVQGGGLNNSTYIDGSWSQQYGCKISTSQYSASDTAGTQGRSFHITINNSATRYGYSAEL